MKLTKPRPVKETQKSESKRISLWLASKGEIHFHAFRRTKKK